MMKSKKFTFERDIVSKITILAIVGLVIISFVSMHSEPTIKQLEENFVLSKDNFDLVSVSYGQNSGDCSSGFRQDYTSNFIITYNLDALYEEQYSGTIYNLAGDLNCYVLLNGVKYYGHIDTAGIREIPSYFFEENPSCDNNGRSDNCNYPRAYITQSTDITLCCEGICKTKTLPAYCP